MILTLTEQEIKQIILTHIESKGFEGVELDDITCMMDSYEDWVANICIKDNVPYQPIEYPKCPKCDGKSYPRCMSLSDYKYCMRVGGVC